MTNQREPTDEMEEGLRVLTAYAPMVTTLDELLDFNEVDLTKWVVDRHIINDWTTPMRDINKDLEYQDGAATGHVKQGPNARFAQNVQVKAWLSPVKPVEILPMIKPITVPSSYKPAEGLTSAETKRHLIFNDTHFGFRRRVNDAKLKPFHSRETLDIIVQVAAAARVDRIDILGDTFDLACFTDKFISSRSPEYYYTLQPALVEAFWWILQLREICSDIRIHEGNHDRRLPATVLKYMPFAYGLRKAKNSIFNAPAVLSIPNLLSLDKLGIEWVCSYPNDRDHLAPKLAVNHGLITRAKPGHTTRALANDGFISEIQGHCHKEEHNVGVRTDVDGIYEVEAWSFGCTCQTDFTVAGHNLKQHWSKGFGLVDVYPNGRFGIQPISVRNGEAIWDGALFKGRGRLKDLKRDCVEWNW